MMKNFSVVLNGTQRKDMFRYIAAMIHYIPEGVIELVLGDTTP